MYVNLYVEAEKMAYNSSLPENAHQCQLPGTMAVLQFLLSVFFFVILMTTQNKHSSQSNMQTYGVYALILN